MAVPSPPQAISLSSKTPFLAAQVLSLLLVSVENAVNRLSLLKQDNPVTPASLVMRKCLQWKKGVIYDHSALRISDI